VLISMSLVKTYDWELTFGRLQDSVIAGPFGPHLPEMANKSKYTTKAAVGDFVSCRFVDQ
jgi:hypothetical protein